jgi:hypothetical protein
VTTTPARKRPPRARCGAPGCTNFARSASGFCAAHKREPVSREVVHTDGVESFGDRTEREDQERRRAAAAEFRGRMEAGDYRGLFGGRLSGLMVQAAAEGGVDDEIAILRIVMARLVAEEDDPVTLSKAIARIASVSIQAARARRAINGQLAEGLTDAITSILNELDAGGGTP